MSHHSIPTPISSEQFGCLLIANGKMRYWYKSKSFTQTILNYDNICNMILIGKTACVLMLKEKMEWLQLKK